MSSRWPFVSIHSRCSKPRNSPLEAQHFGRRLSVLPKLFECAALTGYSPGMGRLLRMVCQGWWFLLRIPLLRFIVNCFLWNTKQYRVRRRGSCDFPDWLCKWVWARFKDQLHSLCPLQLQQCNPRSIRAALKIHELSWIFATCQI